MYLRYGMGYDGSKDLEHTDTTLPKESDKPIAGRFSFAGLYMKALNKIVGELPEVLEIEDKNEEQLPHTKE